MIRVEIVGNIGTGPELKQTKGGKPMCRFSVASTKKQEGREPVTSWVTVLCFGEQAEVVTERAVKGDRVIVTGTMTIEKYEKDGVEKTAVTVLADDVGLSLRWPKRQGGSASPSESSESGDWGGF